MYCLAWEFEMDLRLDCHALEAELGVKIKLVPIPREIMEKNRKEPAAVSGDGRAGSRAGDPLEQSGKVTRST